MLYEFYKIYLKVFFYISLVMEGFKFQVFPPLKVKGEMKLFQLSFFMIVI